MIKKICLLGYYLLTFNQILFSFQNNISKSEEDIFNLEWKTLAKGLEQQLNVAVGDESEIMLNGAEVAAAKLVETLGLSNDHPA